MHDIASIIGAVQVAPLDKVNFPLFVILWNRRQNLTTPQHHLRIANWLDHCWHNGTRHLLLMAFRSSGKSTLVGLFAAWLLYQNPDLRILVLGADQTLAEKMLRATRRIIERHPLTRALKPQRTEQWAAACFTIVRPSELRDPSMTARGITSNITGTRADIVICDDVEVPQTCDTATKRDALREALLEIDYVLVPGGLQLYVGTPHSYYTIYADTPRAELHEAAPFLDNFVRLTLPLLTHQNTSAWPERFSLDDIARIKKHTGPHKFASQMQLEAVNITDARLDPALLRQYDGELRYEEAQGQARLWLGDIQFIAASCWWDPAFSGARDGSVVALVFTDTTGNYYIHRVAYITTTAHSSDDEATQQCEAVASLLDDCFVPSITIETNGIGKFLPARLRQVLAARKIPCAVRDAHSFQNKAQRILAALDAPLAAHALYAHTSLWQTPFIREMREWQPDKNSTRDDGLDAVAGAIASAPMRLKGLSQAAQRTPWHGAASWLGAANFKV